MQRRPVLASGASAVAVTVLLPMANAQQPLQNPPDLNPDLGRIRATARFADGTVPQGAQCLVHHQWQASYMSGPVFRPWPQAAVVGESGDWLVYNLPPGAYLVEVDGETFAWAMAVNTHLVTLQDDDQEQTLSFTVVRGVPVSGRVVSAESGELIEGALVSAGGGRYSKATADDEGRYTIPHMAPGRAFVTAIAEGFCRGSSGAFGVGLRDSRTAPEIQLHPGGWISGRIELPEEIPTGHDVSGRVTPDRLGGWPEGAIGRHFLQVGPFDVDDQEYDGTFRLGPLPAGTYTVEADLRCSRWTKSREAQPPPQNLHWRGEARNIKVVAGDEVRDVVIQATRAE